MNTKQCVKCKETKTIDNFYKISAKTAKRQAQSDFYDYYCKYCRVGQSLKSHRGNNAKKCTASECDKHHYAKGFCRTHYARLVRNGTIERLTNPNKDGVYYCNGKPNHTKEYVIKRRYKMSIDEYTKRSKKGCEICGIKPKANLTIDHDHNCCSTEKTCGKCVRGVICTRCNLLVGKYENQLMRDDNPLLAKIKAYVEKYNG